MESRKDKIHGPVRGRQMSSLGAATQISCITLPSFMADETTINSRHELSGAQTGKVARNCHFSNISVVKRSGKGPFLATLPAWAPLYHESDVFAECYAAGSNTRLYATRRPVPLSSIPFQPSEARPQRRAAPLESGHYLCCHL